jgi:hypothetical protein
MMATAKKLAGYLKVSGIPPDIRPTNPASGRIPDRNKAGYPVQPFLLWVVIFYWLCFPLIWGGISHSRSKSGSKTELWIYFVISLFLKTNQYYSSTSVGESGPF